MTEMEVEAAQTSEKEDMRKKRGEDGEKEEDPFDRLLKLPLQIIETPLDDLNRLLESRGLTKLPKLSDRLSLFSAGKNGVIKRSNGKRKGVTDK